MYSLSIHGVFHGAAVVKTGYKALDGYDMTVTMGTIAVSKTLYGYMHYTTGNRWPPCMTPCDLDPDD